MKSTGIIRQVDELGRIVIPKEIRRHMGITSSDPIEIYVDEEKIILRKYQNACAFCGTGVDLKPYKNRMICQACIDELVADKRY